MIRSILVVLDNSESARFILACATELAEQLEAELHLFRTLEPEPMVQADDEETTRPEIRAARQRLAVLNELKELATGNLKAIQHPPALGRGTPASALVAASIERAADMIVMGSERLAWLAQLVGESTESIALRARCNILVVHGPRTLAS